MKREDKGKLLIILAIFGIAMLGFTAYTIYEYFHYRDGVAVEGIISDVDSYRSGGRRMWRATITATVSNIEVVERVRLPSGGLSVGGLRISSSRLKIGDTIGMLAVPEDNTYSLAIAEDVANPWPELFWELFTVALISICVAIVLKKNAAR